MRKLCVAALSCTVLASAGLLSPGLTASAWADDYIEYPADLHGYPFQRSYLTGRAICIPPYRRPFPVRIYTTPPQPPYYNAPPYAVITGD